MKKPVDAHSYQHIAKVVERTLVLFKISRRKAVSHHHITVTFQHTAYHLRSGFCRIGIVTIRHDIAFRVNFTEHPPDHVSLPLLVFMPDNGAGTKCKLSGTIGGIVVIYIDSAPGKCNTKVLYDFFNRLCLIITGDQNRNFIHLLSPYHRACSVFLSDRKAAPSW